MTTREIVEIVLIFIIFLSGFIPICMGIRENRRLDREEKERAAKAASQRTI